MERAFHGLLQVGICEDNIGRLATQLKRGALEGIGRGFLDNLRCIDVTGEGDLVNPRVHYHRVAGRFTHALEQVDNAWWEADLHGQFGDTHRPHPPPLPPPPPPPPPPRQPPPPPPAHHPHRPPPPPAPP